VIRLDALVLPLDKRSYVGWQALFQRCFISCHRGIFATLALGEHRVFVHAGDNGLYISSRRDASSRLWSLHGLTHHQDCEPWLQVLQRLRRNAVPLPQVPTLGGGSEPLRHTFGSPVLHRGLFEAKSFNIAITSDCPSLVPLFEPPLALRRRGFLVHSHGPKRPDASKSFPVGTNFGHRGKQTPESQFANARGISCRGRRSIVWREVVNLCGHE